MPLKTPAGYNPFVLLRENARLLLGLQECLFGTASLKLSLSQDLPGIIQIERQGIDLKVVVHEPLSSTAYLNCWRIEPEVKAIELSLTGVEFALLPVVTHTRNCLSDWFSQTFGCLCNLSLPESGIQFRCVDQTYWITLTPQDTLELCAAPSNEKLLSISLDGEVHQVSESLEAHLRPLVYDTICPLIA